MAGYHYFNQRQYDAALQEFQKGLEIDPDFVIALWFAGLCYLRKRMFEQAMDCLQKAATLSNRRPFFLGSLGQALGEANRLEEAHEILLELRERSKTEYVSLSMARLYMGIGKTDEALEELEKALQERNVLIWLVSPQFDPLRSDPRFSAFLKPLNLTNSK
jgi:tetratricopeptide (TPR) repeat protein